MSSISFKNRMVTVASKRAFDVLILLTGVLGATTAVSQTLIPDQNSDRSLDSLRNDLFAVESQQPKRDLPCNVSPIKPELGYDFMFHTGYQVDVPIRELAGDGNELTIFYRVVPHNRTDDGVYMTQRVEVPAIDAESEGTGEFQGHFLVGEGRFRVDWVMRDRKGRMCVTSWTVQAQLGSRDIRLREWVPKSLAQATAPLFADEPILPRKPSRGALNLTIIARFDTPSPSSAQLDEEQLEVSIGILRQIRRDSRVASYSLVACSSENQQILFREDNASQIRLPKVGEALRSFKFGVVNAKSAAVKNGSVQFLTRLIGEEMKKQGSDGVVILSHRAYWEAGASHELLNSLASSSVPIFHLAYDSGLPVLAHDPVSSIVRRLHGTEYTVRRPRDIFDAWSDVVYRILRAKEGIPSSLRISEIGL